MTDDMIRERCVEFMNRHNNSSFNIDQLERFYREAMAAGVDAVVAKMKASENLKLMGWIMWGTAKSIAIRKEPRDARSV